MIHDGGRQFIKRDEIRNLLAFRILFHIGIHDAFLSQKAVLELIQCEMHMQSKLIEIIGQQFMRRLTIRLHHHSQARRLCLGRQFIQLSQSWLGHSFVHRAEANIDQFFRIQRSMPISIGSDRFRQHDTRSVHRLPSFRAVDSARNLLDQHRRHTLTAQLLMNAQEVDLHHIHHSVVYRHRSRYRRNTSTQLPRLNRANTKMPRLEVARHHQRPF
mmetsp:Transcript_12682/g.20166  ORF Transcript_12682/g.20166 Transcript_12682/m.20166 type:complete len:215 (-) Transcript_12682:1134-1778(-)